MRLFFQSILCFPSSYSSYQPYRAAVLLVSFGALACFMPGVGEDVAEGEYEMEVITGHVELTADALEARVDATVDDQVCRITHELGGSEIECADWFLLRTWMPQSYSHHQELEYNEATNPAVYVFLIHSDENAESFWGDIDPNQLVHDCGLNSIPVQATRIKLDESEYQPIDRFDWHGVYELAFEHPCVSGKLTYFYNIRLD